MSRSISSRSKKDEPVVPDKKVGTQFMSMRLVEYYQEQLDEICESKASDSDRSEYEEKLGIAQFYYGNYNKAITTNNNIYLIQHILFSLNKIFDLLFKHIRIA